MRVFCLLTAVLLIYSETSFASPQVLNGSSPPLTVTLDNQGANDGVDFINQSIGENTLLVPGGSTVNSNKNTFATQTDTNGKGNIQFDGGKGNNTKVFGKVGNISSLYMDTISLGGLTVTFEDAVHCNQITFLGGGTINFNANLNLLPGGSINFSNLDAVVNLSKDTTVTGNLGVYPNPSGGLVYMSEGSKIIGDVAVDFLHFRSTKDSSAQISGSVVANSIVIGYGEYYYANPVIQGDLTTGNLSLGRIPLYIVGNCTLNNPFISVGQNDRGNILVEGTTTINGAVDLSYTFRVKPRPTKFSVSWLVLNSTVGGTSGATINIINVPDWRETFYGVNQNGNIFITNTPTTSPPIPPVTTGCPWWLRGLGGCSQEVMLQLCPVADDYIGSDLDFIERQLAEPTWEDYTADLYQLYPAPALIGVAQESFNTTKQFQKVFLKNIYRHSSKHTQDCFCCCEFDDTQSTVWVDGFGSYGRQSNDDPGKGYESRIWGGVAASDTMINCNTSVGLGIGYASTLIEKSPFTAQEAKDNYTDINSYQGTAYVSWTDCSLFADAGLSAGWNRYHGKRYIEFNEVDRVASSKYNGQEFSGFVVAGYDFCLQRYVITPFMSGIYSYLHLDSYRETGADILNLRIKSQYYHFMESGLGLKLASCFSTSFGVFFPGCYVTWQHQYLNRCVDVTASFSNEAALGGYFHQVGPKGDVNRYNIGFNLTYCPIQNFKLLLDYDFERSCNYFVHQGLIQATYLY